MNIPYINQQFFDNQGQPLSSGSLYTYTAGSTTIPKTTYLDSGLTILAPNPITLNASGRPPKFYMTTGGYNFVLKDSIGQIIDTWDYQYGTNGGSAGSSDHKVATSLNDTNPDYLIGKVIPGDGMDVIEVVGATRQLEVSSKGLAKVSMGDSAGYLDSKFNNSDTISWTSNGHILTPSVKTSVTADIGKVKSTSADTNDYLFDKFVASNTVSPSLSPDNKHISFDVDLEAVVDNKVKHNYFDDIPGYLNAKVKAGAGITITSATDGVNGDQLIINSRTNSWRPIKYVNNNYTVIDTDDTLIILGNFSTVTIPTPSVQYEGRVITLQANGGGYSTTAYCPGGSIVGDTPVVANYSKIELLCASNGSVYVWICKGQA